MKSARIGVTSPLRAGDIPSPDTGIIRHCAALERAGAEPILLRSDADPLQVIESLELRGLVFTGGGDIYADRYGGNEALAQEELDIQRDAFEFALIEHAFKKNIPILAVCRGMQIANVALGGTLIEDLRYHMGTAYRLAHHQVNDAGKTFQEHTHSVTVKVNSVLHGITGTHFAVNSIHHQAIRTLASGLVVSARADDGVIEAIELEQPSTFFIGVQWHPEWLPDDPVSHALYARFVQVCDMTFEPSMRP